MYEPRRRMVWCGWSGGRCPLLCYSWSRRPLPRPEHHLEFRTQQRTCRDSTVNVACYVTAIAWNRQRLLARPDVARVILEEVEFYRSKYKYCFCGFVIMPDHWHFVFITDEEKISPVLRDMKSMIARLVVDKWKKTPDGTRLLEKICLPVGEKRQHTYSLWQEGNWKTLIEQPSQIERRLDYMHANPIRAGLVERAEDWKLSSYRWYEFREPVGATIDMDWF